jgi:magnesium-transporting ATPase (P-type)
MDPASPPATAWHAQTLSEVFQALDAQTEGLEFGEAQRRMLVYGSNRLRPPKRRGPLVRFLLQFHNVLIYVLLVAAAVTFALEHWLDASVILGVVVVNAVIGFLQEGKAERALESIRKLLSLQATVLRDGEKARVAADTLVPGDVVLLASGDKVPADLRLFRTKGLHIQEALLTGESVPVEKGTKSVAAASLLGDRTCMAYSGTLITYGQGAGVVVATGDATEVGRIGAMLAEVQTLTTPLLRKLARFSLWLSAAILIVAALTFAFGVAVRQFAPAEMFLAAVGLAVAAIPEGLPAILTIALAIGVQRMAQRNAIIRRLPAVETLGSVTVICSDKTGTLTRNEMTVQDIATAHTDYGVTGVGYDPEGSVTRDGSNIRPADHPVLVETLRAGLLCNEASLRHEADGWAMEGDPTEGALVTAARKAGLDADLERKAYPRADTIPFEAAHRLMATLHHDHEGRGYIFVKGAPERILELCSRERCHDGDRPLAAATWQRRIDEIAAKGRRLLAVAGKDAPAGKHELTFADVEGGLTLFGVVGLIDPPRNEAIEAVARCRAAGIAVKMITGDHARTAAAVARQLVLDNPDEVVTGRDIDSLDDSGLREAASRSNVFARTSPEHKLRLVEALQANGQVTAMTGDGVNDAPALKRADVGVAMGVKGTEAAKEAAEMVLADDNFASLAHAVEEGRTVHDNLWKAIIFILPTNGAEAGSIILAVLLGRTLPVTAVQILWINMATAVTLALALAFEPTEGNVMQRPPRPPEEPLLTGFLVWRTLFVTTILVAGTIGLFSWERSLGAGIERARTVAVNTLVLFEVFYLFNCRSLDAPMGLWTACFGSRAVTIAVVTAILLQLGFTYSPPMQVLFSTEALDAADWVRIVAVTVSVYVLVEAEKRVMRALRPDRKTADRSGSSAAGNR